MYVLTCCNILYPCWQGRDKLIGDANKSAAVAAVGNGGGVSGVMSSISAQVSECSAYLPFLHPHGRPFSAID